MKTILFLSDQNRYLESDLYLKLVETFNQEFRCVYFESDFKNNITYKRSEDFDRKEKRRAFEEYRILAPVQLNTAKLTNPVLKAIRIWRNFIQKLRWRDSFLRIIDVINPDLCILITTITPNAKMLCSYRSNITKVYLQPTTNLKEDKKKIGPMLALKYWLYESIFRLPILPTRESCFNNYPNIHYLLWSENWINHIKRNPLSTYLSVGSPLFDDLCEKEKYEGFKNESLTCLIILNKEKRIGLDAWYTYLNFYKKVISENSDVKFILKVHPLGDIRRVQDQFPAAMITKDSLPIDSVDIVITHWSSLAFQSMIMGVLTILVNPGGEFDFAKRYFEDYEFIIEDVPSINVLVEKIREQDLDFFGGAVQKFLRTKLTEVDGKSSGRVTEYLRGLLNDS